jgi:hypothetical protein
MRWSDFGFLARLLCLQFDEVKQMLHGIGPRLCRSGPVAARWKQRMTRRRLKTLPYINALSSFLAAATGRERHSRAPF